MAVAMGVPTCAGVVSLPRASSHRNSVLDEPFGVGTTFSTLKGWERRAVEEVQIRRLSVGIVGRGRVRVRGSSCVTTSLNGEGVSGVEDSGSDAALWLTEIFPLELERGGVDVDRSRRIAEACAEACAAFLATRRAFDPMMIVDAMEEEIERRDLRGDDFLPFELGRKAARVLTQRWNELPVAERPRSYCQRPYVNEKDVVDFDKWPKNLNFP